MQRYYQMKKPDLYQKKDDRNADYCVEALFSLLQTMPYDEISISALVAKAGLDRATFYRRFRNKRDLVHYYFDTLIKETHERFENMKNQSYENFVQTLLSVFLENKERVLLLNSQDLMPALLNVMKGWGNYTVSEVSPNPILESYLSAAVAYGLIMAWMEADMTPAPKIMAEQFIAMYPQTGTKGIERLNAFIAQAHEKLL